MGPIHQKMADEHKARRAALWPVKKVNDAGRLSKKEKAALIAQVQKNEAEKWLGINQAAQVKIKELNAKVAAQAVEIAALSDKLSVYDNFKGIQTFFNAKTSQKAHDFKDEMNVAKEIVKRHSQLAGVPVSIMMGHSQRFKCSESRQKIIWEIRMTLDWSYKKIGFFLNGRHHTTILKAVQNYAVPRGLDW